MILNGHVAATSIKLMLWAYTLETPTHKKNSLRASRFRSFRFLSSPNRELPSESWEGRCETEDNENTNPIDPLARVKTRLRYRVSNERRTPA